MQKLTGSSYHIAILGRKAYQSALDVSAQPQDSALEIGFSCDRDAGSIAFTMTFRNLGSTDTALLIGAILGNGRKYLASELALEVRSADGSARYSYVDPSVPGIAGRRDLWVVELPAESSFSITRPWNPFLGK